MWGQTELRTVDLSCFGIKVATIDYKTFSEFTMESPTGFSTITWFQRNPNLDSKGYSIFHKQRCMTSKKPRPQSLGLFCLVHFGDKGLCYPSHFCQVSQRETAKGMGSNSLGNELGTTIPHEQIRTAYDAFVNRLEAVVRNKDAYIE
ncbi:hypothetical protein FHG87_014579 [Trinorchestia longiramus]|nr:hypothetical protein FHG87_014579 [Trinorchestia longiramus]